MNVLSLAANPGQSLGDENISKLVGDALPIEDYRGQKILLIVPDHTRTAPVGLLFKNIHRQIGEATAALDVMIALGTHPPMDEEAICKRLEISPEERREEYAEVQLHNHEWNNPNALKEIGVIPASDIAELSGGRFEMELPVTINRRLFDYDQIIIVGPVFPHEVVGFSGGNKYLFPGVSGPELLNFFHWLGAVISNPKIIGHKWTAVRKVVDRAGGMVAVDKRCFAMVVRPDKSLAGLFFGTPESAWDAAADLSDKTHIVYKDRPFHTVLSCAPPMYDDIWVGGKCMYKLEPVLADEGELIIYGPHINSISHTHEAGIQEVGYHCSSWLLEHWEKYKNHPWGLLAHSSHVKGIGQVIEGTEKPRANVTLATGLSEEVCRQINLGYRNPESINIEDYADREDEGVLLVRKAGEMLYRLNDPPTWALP
jgi:nickel-dependent lactate racemase